VKLPRDRSLVLYGILLLPFVLLGCNYPLALSGAYDQLPAAPVWITATSPPFSIPTAGPEATLVPLSGSLVDQPASGILPPPPQSDPNADSPILYYSLAGDTLPALARRFAVNPGDITSPEPIPSSAMINPNQLLIIPDRLEQIGPNQRLLPDSEFVYSPTAIDFNIQDYVTQAGGYLSSYKEFLGSTGETSGADIVQRVAIENSVNPRLLLALLEYQSNWVTGKANELNLAQKDYPIGLVDLSRKGLYRQLTWAVSSLSTAYYGWREGSWTDLRYADGSSTRLAPDLNAGTVALQQFFAGLHAPNVTEIDLDEEIGFPALYEEMFGNPWMRAQTVEPLFPPDLAQPDLTLPFALGQLWSFSGGPHGAWERDGARAALDFAPGSTEPGCVRSNKLVLAAAPGFVTRSGHGVVVLDLDGDGYEQTGWSLLYLHVSTNGGSPPAPEGTWVDHDDLLGYPSCEGGLATGTHIHIARKYNGEWILADGPLPFNLDGWIAHAGNNPYEGALTREDLTIVANQLGTFSTNIRRDQQGP
jgi:LasA protease